MMEKVYDPKIIESKWLEIWDEKKLYTPKLKKGRKNYSILLPPPNANASLHIGHAMFIIEDILIRYHRMLGDNTVWVPGTDHAGIETQYVFEKQLAKEGKSRFQFNREDLYNSVAKFVDENSGLIENQLKKLGFSLDWSRKTFTLDSQVVRTVYDTFEKMYRDGLIYRDNYIVNYCTHCGTSFSELEVEYKDRVDPLVYMKYGPFVLATVRPETKFGDTAVAVNPKDERYKQYVGQEIEVEGLLGKFKIKVIADEFVDMEFGTGVVKVTPAHDPNDFAMGRRHGLEVKQVIGLDGRLNGLTGPYAGMKVNEARKKVIEDMKEKGLIEKIDESYAHRVSVCYRCKRDIEPLVLPNWFLKVKGLTDRAIDAAKTGKIKFVPQRFEEEYYRRLENIRDWPISRQIVWGIRIPAWYDVAKNPDLHVTFLDPRSEQGEGIKGPAVLTGPYSELIQKGYTHEQIESGLQKVVADNTSIFVIADKKPTDGGLYLPETDTFDTWFSSGQWPLVTLGYPDGEDFKTFYPTDVLDTMWDILFFWVYRMIMFGLYLTDEVPFKTVHLHSRVVDEKGQKMSKSKGNVVNPLEMMDKYGTDAFRISLIAGAAPGNDIAISDNKVKGYRNFTNKIWNSARFVMDFNQDNTPGLSQFSSLTETTIFHIKRSNFEKVARELSHSPEDENILTKLLEVKEYVEDSIEKYRFSDASLALYEFYWHEFCDKYIEHAKDKREATQPILEFVLKSSMELLHPFMPFVTEDIWQKLPHTGESISIVE